MTSSSRARAVPLQPSALAALALSTMAGCTGDAAGGGPSVPAGGRPSGVSIRIIGGPGDTPGRFTRPRGVACEPDGTLYVVDMAGYVQRLSASGEPLARVEMPATAAGKPNGVAFVPPSGPREEALLAIADTHYRRITVLRARDLTLVGHRAEDAFEFPTSVLSLGERWIVTAYGDRSQLAVLAGKKDAVLERWGHDGDGPGEFNRPMGVAMGPEGDLYVADSCNHRIQVIGADGSAKRTMGTPGTGPGALRYPYGIAVDGSGHVIVAEYGNQRLQVFDGVTGRSLRVFGRPGGAPGEFSSPWGLALDASGRVYVADRDNHRVQALSGLLEGLPAAGAATPRPPG